MDDELDVKDKDEESGLYLFFVVLTLTSFFSFCWNVLLSLDLMKGNFFSLTCVGYLAYLLKKALGLPIPSLLADHINQFQPYQFFAQPHHLN